MRTDDHVTTERDGTDPEVLGRDGFWAAKRNGVWSNKVSSPIQAPWASDRVVVTDPVLATALSNEARSAIK
jgi:hypothetical protein